ncbi:hypothetical protein GN958_ATG19681 [Phytophthora infestans]|uniref:Uncharacterized protein n=1 Tax=Phytophthora infestans TaxID=4787 RepID=A0A8S9TQH6_PHYIN|nr:hypothetical protein GN958_ATG19681 [Phytophthora infestans]
MALDLLVEATKAPVDFRSEQLGLVFHSFLIMRVSIIEIVTDVATKTILCVSSSVGVFDDLLNVSSCLTCES